MAMLRSHGLLKRLLNHPGYSTPFRPAVSITRRLSLSNRVYRHVYGINSLFNVNDVSRSYATSSEKKSPSASSQVESIKRLFSTIGGDEERNKKLEMVDELASVLKRDTELLHRLARKLDPMTRAQVSHVMLEANNVSFSASRNFDKADKNHDGYITISEFTSWFKDFEDDKKKMNTVVEPTTRQLMRLSLSAGLPFVAFGFFDNVIMLVAGDYIDVTFGVTFGLSTLAAAGLGNMVSDVAGIGIGGVVTSAAARIPFLNPNLTRAQLELPISQRVNVSAQCVGIVVGCLLGMFPLALF